MLPAHSLSPCWHSKCNSPSSSSVVWWWLIIIEYDDNVDHNCCNFDNTCHHFDDIMAIILTIVLTLKIQLAIFIFSRLMMIMMSVLIICVMIMMTLVTILMTLLTIVLGDTQNATPHFRLRSSAEENFDHMCDDYDDTCDRVDIWRDRCDRRSCKILVSRVNFQKILGLLSNLPKVKVTALVHIT